MGKKGKGKKGGKGNAYVVDTVDTTSLTKKQLQTFCEKVYQEIVKTNLESRSLELERNKLKTMVALSTQGLLSAKRNKRAKELELGQTHEANTFGTEEQQKQLRNVRSEMSQEVMVCMTEVENNLQILQRDSDECKTNIEQDLKQMRNTVVLRDKARNDKMIMLKQELEKEKSSLLNTSDNNSKLQTSRYEKQMSEIALKLMNKNTKEIEEFNEYKIRKINEYLKENDKLNVNLRHYYEKLLQRNMNVLDSMHETYKSVKDDVKHLQSMLKTQKEDTERSRTVVEDNNEKIRELSEELASSKRDQKKLKCIKEKLISKQNKLKNQQWDNLFLEEALRIMKKEQKADHETKDKIFFSLKNKVASELLNFECWAKKIMTLLTKINSIIETRTNKESQNLSISSIREIAFAQLEAEAKKEERQNAKNEFSSLTSLNLQDNPS